MPLNSSPSRSISPAFPWKIARSCLTRWPPVTGITLSNGRSPTSAAWSNAITRVTSFRPKLILSARAADSQPSDRWRCGNAKSSSLANCLPCHRSKLPDTTWLRFAMHCAGNAGKEGSVARLLPTQRQENLRKRSLSLPLQDFPSLRDYRRVAFDNRGSMPQPINHFTPRSR